MCKLKEDYSRYICNICAEKMNRGEIPYIPHPVAVWYGGSEKYQCYICGHIGKALDFNLDE